jgi:hypothetical protein
MAHHAAEHTEQLAELHVAQQALSSQLELLLGALEVDPSREPSPKKGEKGSSPTQGILAAHAESRGYRGGSPPPLLSSGDAMRDAASARVRQRGRLRLRQVKEAEEELDYGGRLSA